MSVYKRASLITAARQIRPRRRSPVANSITAVGPALQFSVGAHRSAGRGRPVALRRAVSASQRRITPSRYASRRHGRAGLGTPAPCPRAQVFPNKRRQMFPITLQRRIRRALRRRAVTSGRRHASPTPIRRRARSKRDDSCGGGGGGAAEEAAPTPEPPGGRTGRRGASRTTGVSVAVAYWPAARRGPAASRGWGRTELSGGRPRTRAGRHGARPLAGWRDEVSDAPLPGPVTRPDAYFGQR